MKELGIRRKISIAIGAAQSTLGVLASVFAYVLYHNFFNVQEILSVSSQDVAYFMMVLIVFGVLSVIGGLFLLNEQ
jgi:hypothetical protein